MFEINYTNLDREILRSKSLPKKRVLGKQNEDNKIKKEEIKKPIKRYTKKKFNWTNECIKK